MGSRNERGEVTILFHVSDYKGTQDVDAIVANGKAVRIIGGIGSDALEGFGSAVASAGDVNGDGLTDLVVADPKYRDPAGRLHGRVYLIYGSRSFPPLVRADDLGNHGVILDNPEVLQGFVAGVFGGGDLDGDGLSEFGFSLMDTSGSAYRGELLIVHGDRALPGTIQFAALQDGPLGFKVQPSSLEAL